MELRRRKEVEETLARERAEMERDRREVEDMMERTRKADARSAEMEVEIAGSERAVSELEARLAEAYDELLLLGRRDSGGPTTRREQEVVEGEVMRLGGGFRRFSYAELAEATNQFDESIRIDGGGDGGGRGKVYRGSTIDGGGDVAVEEVRFAREVEAVVAGTSTSTSTGIRRAGGLVAVLGACPEARAVVYELVPGGRSLEDRLHDLPWRARCGVALRTCSALAFVHCALKTVHGDVRPANILLLDDDSCKLSGLGTRRLVARDAARPAYADLVATTGEEPTPPCDVYSLGVVLLRLVTGMSPFLAMKAAREAADGAKQWHEVVDRACGWPADRAREVALVALKCCRDQTNRSGALLLEEIRGVLEDALRRSRPGRAGEEEAAPSYFLCPILKEVMRDPMIAGDGFSYEAEAIREWLDTGHDASPMTNLKLPTRDLTLNHALRSAILEWLATTHALGLGSESATS